VPDSFTSILIALKGIDGAGKTTQVEMLREAWNVWGSPPLF
jgi:thymidylate kinase